VLVGIIPNPYTERRCGNGKPKEKYTDLVVDRSDTKAYIRELQAVSRNINQIAKRANATGTVYRQDIEDIKKAVDEIWRLQRRTLLNQP